MNATRVLRQHRQPMIKFIGHHTAPAKLDHTPVVHPASPSKELPSSFSNTFASYRKNASQHGPLGGRVSMSPAGVPLSATGKSLGTIEPTKGQFFDRSELPARFGRTPFSPEEMDAIESGGASMFA